MLGVVACYGVPAYPRPMAVTQPDGTTLTIRLHGDEFFHWASTTDGHEVAQTEDGYYRFAERRFDGSLRTSQHVARDAGKRDAETAAFLRAKTTADPALFASGMYAQARQQLAIYRDKTAVGERTRAGNKKHLVVLAQFQDKGFQSSNGKAAFENLLNGTGVYSSLGGDGAKKYYLDNSGGVFDTEFVVAGPVTLPKMMSYYGGNGSNGTDVDSRVREFAADACQAAATFAGVNFADYATNNVVESVFIFYAGQNEAEGGPDDTIWPHSFIFPANTVINGVTLKGYACTSELSRFNRTAAGAWKMASIGVFCHEFGHTLDLPDFYDTDEGNNGYSIGLDALSLMSYGSYNYDGIVPPALSFVERSIIGWDDNPILIDSVADTDVVLQPYPSSGRAILAPAPDEADEYFIFESRSNNLTDAAGRWDKYIGGTGLVVYHIDRSSRAVPGSGQSAANLWNRNRVNAYRAHECAYLLPARPGAKDKYISPGTPVNMAEFYFPGVWGSSTLSAVSSGTKLLTWDGNSIGYSICTIQSSATGEVSFRVIASDVESPPPPANTRINVKSIYLAGESVFLVADSPKEIRNMKWYVDGVQESDTSVKLPAGEHILKAVCMMGDGTIETIYKFVNVND